MNDVAEDKKLLCGKCDLELIPQNTVLKYMGFDFNLTTPRCPGCGLVYIPPDLALGKMVEVETMLEDK